jgi:hypothetical protein
MIGPSFGLQQTAVTYVQHVTGNVKDGAGKPILIRQRLTTAVFDVSEKANVVLVNLKDGTRASISGPAKVKCNGQGWTVMGGSVIPQTAIDAKLLRHMSGPVAPSRILGEIIRDPGLPFDRASLRPYGAVAELTAISLPFLQAGDRCSVRVYEKGKVLVEGEVTSEHPRMTISSGQIPVGQDLSWSLTLFRGGQTYDCETPIRVLTSTDADEIHRVQEAIPLSAVVAKDADVGLVLMCYEAYLKFGMAGQALDLIRVADRVHPEFGLSGEVIALEDALRGKK